MPYTPPSHRSPPSSAPTSPNASRRPSLQAGASRPSLPRSASYLTRHRRTPSAPTLTSHVPASQLSPEATSEDLKSMVTNASVRQSPPPITGDGGMPKGAVISPPETSSSSSDEDEMPEVPEARGRRIDNLQELHDAVSQIPQPRASSPSNRPDLVDMLILPSRLDEVSDSMKAIVHQSPRRSSHVRSATEPNVLVTKSADASLTGSEEESEDEIRKKPQMVRKKSGELVRPALRPASRRRPSSMPGTPTFGKNVHFDSHLEHVRHFLQVDRPLAVSAGSSPVENYDSDGEYPFGSGSSDQVRSPPFEWEMIVTNFPVETPARKAQPVMLERVWLSNDQKFLHGSVAVANLAFQKYIACRFTLDYWKTTSEVTAEYSAEILPREATYGRDRFTFTIRLSDLANLEAKTLYFCIRYNVNGQEFWDNNGGTNFQIDFRKKMLPQNGKNGFRGASSRPANALPRSTRRANPSTAPRPKSMPVGFDEFGDASKINFDLSLQDYLGDAAPTLRLRATQSSSSIPSDNLAGRLSSPSGQAFANRYDFGASLTAAMQAAKDSMSSPDGLYMKSNRKPTPAAHAAAKAVAAATADAPKPAAKAASEDQTKSAAPNRALPPVPAAGTGSPGSASISSASYDEIVSKYCFFGSKQSSPPTKDGTLRGGQYDGTMDEYVTQNSRNSSNNSSLEGSPLQMSNLRNIHGALHHSLHPKDPNPYFHHTSASMGGGYGPSSPTGLMSPPRQLGERTGSPSNNQQQPRNMTPMSNISSARSASPASMVGGFPPFAGTSTNEYSYQQMSERFPFTGTETHAATAIRG